MDLKEIKTEHCYSPYIECILSEENLHLKKIDENINNNDLELEGIVDSKFAFQETTMLEKNPLEKTIKKENPKNSHIIKLKKTTMNQTIKEKRPTCKTDQVDNFFQENPHHLKCSICHEPLSDFHAAKAHYRSVHNTRGYVICCSKKYYKRCVLVDHLRVHADPNFFKCEYCAKTFQTRRGLEMHVDGHYKVRETNYKCDECGKAFLTKNNFQRHKVTHVPDSEKTFNCSQCEKSFVSNELRQRHEDSTHARKNDKICDICGKSFRFALSFLRHMEEHAGIPQSMVTCDICGINLTNKYGLKQHKRMRHVEKNLQEQICPYCSKVSPNVNAHRRHIRYSHTLLRNHACHLCKKAFRLPVELKEHLATHTGEALYTCSHCPRTFTARSNMHKHRKDEHRVEWEESRSHELNKKYGENILSSCTTGEEKEAVQIVTEGTTPPISVLDVVH